MTLIGRITPDYIRVDPPNLRHPRAIPILLTRTIHILKSWTIENKSFASDAPHWGAPDAHPQIAQIFADGRHQICVICGLCLRRHKNYWFPMVSEFNTNSTLPDTARRGIILPHDVL
jgi:hypothetical protein